MGEKTGPAVYGRSYVVRTGRRSDGRTGLLRPELQQMGIWRPSRRGLINVESARRCRRGRDTSSLRPRRRRRRRRSSSTVHRRFTRRTRISIRGGFLGTENTFAPQEMIGRHHFSIPSRRHVRAFVRTSSFNSFVSEICNGQRLRHK